jgi:hypothetical protein
VTQLLLTVDGGVAEGRGGRHDADTAQRQWQWLWQVRPFLYQQTVVASDSELVLDSGREEGAIIKKLKEYFFAAQ